MSYNVICSADFGASNTGLTLNGKLFDSAGVQVGATITSGFVEPVAGLYLYVLSAPDDHAGVFVIYKSTDASLRRTVVVAPRETEYSDIKISTRLASAAYSAPPSAAAIDSQLSGTHGAGGWATATGFSTLTTSDIDARLNAYDAATGADVTAVAATVAAQNPSSVDGAALTMRRAVTYDGTISGLSIIPASWTKCLFTVKVGTWLPDSQATIQIQVSNPSDGNDGLILLNGASSTLANASLSVSQGAGTVTIHIEDDALAAVAADSYQYDLKFYYGTSDTVATAPATCIINDVVTETV